MNDGSSAAPRGRPFGKGKSGNPRGRPQGARNRTTLAAEALLEGEAEALTRKIIELAKGGDITALRICFDRIFPRARERRVNFQIPPIRTTADRVEAMDAITSALTAGDITINEAMQLAQIVEIKMKAVHEHHQYLDDPFSIS